MKFVLKMLVLTSLIVISKLSKEPSVAQHKSAKALQQVPVLTQNNIGADSKAALMTGRKIPDPKLEKVTIQLN